ncbi:MAG: protein kinase domain-containing protein [Planctomycetota bacterium]
MQQQQMIGPYEILGELGRGGMGVVYRARHATLGHDVALKVIQHGAGGSSSATAIDPASTDGAAALAARFRREAEAAGRLSGHPNIVAVHDFGEVLDDGNGRSWLYLAMDLVEGRPLDELIEEGELTVEESARLIAQTARALAHAHAAGVLHRDVKPSNILVQQDGTARLADFGLAQSRGADPDVTRLTKSGELLGTPAYMPPEQARGEGVDARADVYSLGASLYDCLTGGPPFRGDSTFRVIAGVLREEPRPPRTHRPGLPRALDAIVLRCLEKEPGERYQSAGALADDLERFLGGAAVQARERGTAAKLWRRMRGSPKLLAGGAAAVLLAASGGIAAWSFSQRTATDTGKLKRESKELSAAEAAGRVSAAWLALQRDSLGAMRTLEDSAQGADVTEAQRDAALAAVHAAVETARRGAPEVHAVDGWLALALTFAGRADEAKQRFDQAVEAADPALDPFPRLLRARLELSRYVALMPTPGVSIGSDYVRLHMRDETEEMAAARERALRDLAAIPEAAWRALRSIDGERTFAAGAAAVAREEWDTAVGALATLRDDPALAAAAAMLGGFAAFQAKAFPEAAARWEAAGGRGWPHALELAAIGHMAEAVTIQTRGEDPQTRLRRAIQLFTEAVPRLADPREAMLNLGHSHLSLGYYLAHHGGDGLPDLRTGVDVLGRLIERDGTWLVPYVARGAALGVIASRLRTAGEDPMPTLQRALDDYNHAVQLNPNYTSALTGRAELCLQAARVFRSRGKDAAHVLKQGLADATEAVRLEPTRADFHSKLGQLHAEQARWLMSRGEDPRADLEAGLAALETAVRLRPDSAAKRLEYGLGLAERSMWAERTGERRIPWLDRAVAEFSEALQRNPNSGAALAGRADAYHERGRAKARRGGGDPNKDYLAAVADYDAALRIDPQNGLAFNNRGYTHSDLARLAIARREDPAPWFAKALADYATVLGLRANNKDAWVNRGHVLLERAEYGMKHGRDPTSDLLAAEQAQSEAIRLNPREANAYGHRARVHEIRAKIAQGREEDPVPHLNKGLADYNTALELNPGEIRLLNARCLFHQTIATVAETRGADPRPHLKDAIADLDRALAQNPNYIFGYINRANACNRIAEYEQRTGGDWLSWYRQSHAAAVKAHGINPNDYNAVMMRGYTADRAGLAEEALEYYARALQMREHPGIRANYERLKQKLGR